MSASAAPRGRHVAVDGSASEAAAAELGERRSVTRRLSDAARRSALAQARGMALLWGGHGLAAALMLAMAGAGGSQQALWLATAAACATVMLLWRHPKDKATHPGLFVAAVNAGAVLQALACWLAPPATPGLALMAVATSVGTAMLLATWPATVWAAAGVAPWLACVSPALGGSTASAVATAATSSALALAACMLRRRAWLSTARAIVEQVDRLRQLEGERDRAWRHNQEKSRFLAIASHDLRQPVHALGLFAASLHKRLATSADEPLARNLVRAVDALERSFNAMLDVSKLDAGALVPHLQTFALRDLFRRLHMQYAGQAELAGLGLRFSPGGKAVTSDPQLLERIVGNLVQNALKYTTQGGVVVVARSTAERINIEVWDTGSGIAPADLPRIFEEFYQVGRAQRDRAHGLGMGLAIVKRLAALLQHRLEVVSQPGRGTLFRVGVPIGGLPGIQDELAPADTQPMAIDRPLVVLVVDDEEAIREGVRLLLLEWGYQPVTAADADEAERAVQALDGHVDLVLSDLHLGDGADGVDVIAAVRRLCGPELPAILITGDTGHEQLQRIASAGAVLLFKPVPPRQLFNALQAALA
ncbi:ATP-binding protein [Roseateles sp.]|uniref:hybrid sensor histidine kinase/response regulator n=1 Tax=Roseateles sp. TaxID=1971397 RepID=UPI0039ED50EC